MLAILQGGEKNKKLGSPIPEGMDREQVLRKKREDEGKSSNAAASRYRTLPQVRTDLRTD